MGLWAWIRWIFRIVFILLPLGFGIAYTAFLGVIHPLFFGNGTAAMKEFFTSADFMLLRIQVPLLFVINWLYTPFLKMVCRIYQHVECSMIEAVDKVYDRMFGGGYGRGESAVVSWICIVFHLFCFLIGIYSAFIIMGYLFYEGIGNLDFSWSAWMKLKSAEKITYRWIPLIICIMLFLRPLLHIADRPVRGVIERASGYLNKSNY